jgi:eukaryotic-like serine/threonine-protein kinase
MGALPKPKLDPETTTTYTPAPGRAFLGITLGDKYEVTGILGTGGMGVVCEARHKQLGGKRFAVKLVQRYFAGSELAAARFRREVRAVAAIESEHIVQITDVGTDDRFGLYMVMEHLTGEDLATHLHRVGRVKTIDALRIALQIARGVGAAHAASILHRDLKPGNVFLIPRAGCEPFVKIFDFGVSKLMSDPDASGTWSADLTGVGMPVGTPQYMSPEQAHGVSDLDARTDVWALGAVLFEMLAGRAPYEPKGRAHHTIMRIMTEPPPRIEHVAPWVPPAVARIVNAALESNRERRIPDCQSFAELLEQAIPAALRAPEPQARRPRTDNEVTKVAPSPTPDPASLSVDIRVSAASLPPHRAPMPTTPLPEQLSAYTPSPRPTPVPLPDMPASRHPSSHIRVSKDMGEEQTVLLDLGPTPTPVPTFVGPRKKRARGRGMLGMLALSLVLTAAAVVTGQAAKEGRLPSLRTYAAAPAGR